ncbi:MAG: hypothetical protein IJ762_06725 [Bacteroidaceae bacterium]|nr:hypothetical protein [Bacteroidaceae bacterium]
MKTKKLFLMAAMLLASVCAFAQSGNNEPLRGDVNGDGKVNIADVTELVNIILNKNTPAPQVTYYLYMGTTKPTSLSQAEQVSSYESEYTYTNNSGSKAYIHVLTNSDKTVNFYNPADPTAPATKVEDTSTIQGYKITSMDFRVSIGGTMLIKIS